MLPTSSNLIDAIVEGLKDYHSQLVLIVGSLTPEQCTIRVAPNLRSVGEIVAHIIAARAGWFYDVLHEGSDEIGAMGHWDEEDQPDRTPAEFVSALQGTWKMIEDALTRWTPQYLAVQIVLPWIGPKYPITRPWVIWHLIEHDLHHGGELAHTLGMQGLTIELPPGPPADAGQE